MTANAIAPIADEARTASAAAQRANLWSAAADVLQSHGDGPPLEAKPSSGRAVLSSAQERLWFIQHATPDWPAYNLSFAWRVRGPLNLIALEQALNAIVQRHSVLRTTFEHVNGELMGEASRGTSVRLTTTIDLPAELAAIPFDLRELPLIRVNAMLLEPDDCILTFVLHHIIFDGWSRACFLRELKAHYAAALQGRPAALPTLPVQYEDYARWHRQRVASGLLEPQIEYWRQRLAAPLAQLELPTDHPRPAERTGAGAALFYSLPRPLWAGVDRVRREHSTTRFVVLLAAFQALLQRYTGQEDIVVGSAAANRNRPELRNLIGFFVNTLVLRTQVPHDIRFRDLLARAEETTRGAFANQEVPFERVIEELKPERVANRVPFFQVMFALQNTGRADLELEGTRARRLPVHNGGAKFDLSVEWREDSRGLTAMIEYDTALFDRATVHRMARQFAILLEAAVANPDQAICDLPLLTAEERRAHASIWNATDSNYPRHLSVPALFTRMAAAHPSAIALASETDRCSYAELEMWSNSVARRLEQLGVQPGMPVAVAAQRSAASVASMLGILKAGGAYVPLEPSYPRERLEFMLRDCGATVLVGEKVVLDAMPVEQLPLLYLDDLEHSGAPFAVKNISPEAVACVFYTSGSTGAPKGVCVPHRGIVRLVQDTNYIDIGVDDVIAQAASLSFDAATFEIWGALLNGARVQFIAQDIVLSPVELAEALQRHHVTVAFLTTSLFNLVAREVPDAFRTLRALLFGGESADASAVRAVLGAGAPRRLLNVYGPTETTTFATWHAITALPANATTIPIGRPIANTQVHLLDVAGNVVPLGVRGEIYIGGDGVALGYLNRPDLTLEKFVERRIDRTGAAPVRLYRTGDFGRRLADGTIEFLGRVDDQVKIRGFRVEPRELEMLLGGHLDLAGCCVVVRERGPAGKHLVAYLVPAPRRKISASDIRHWLAARVPEHMVPSRFVCVSELPLNANGKVDRRALPEPAATPGDDVEVKPWIPLHVQLAQIWEEILQVGHVGVRDNFFELGGHSLLAVRLMDRIEQVCGKRLAVSTLFECATVEQLASAILKMEAATAKPIIEVQRGNGQTPLFFVHGDLYGGGLYCLNLARLLGSEQPFYTLPPHAITPGGSPPSIEAMAADHLRALARERPSGPYVLGGFCIGGIIALEMAHQLTQEGERVELLVLVDPPPPHAFRWLRRYVSATGLLAREDPDEQLRRFKRGYKRVYRLHEIRRLELVRQLKFLNGSLRRRTSINPAPAADSTDTAMAYLWSGAGFRPRRYLHPTLMFCCPSVLDSTASRIRAWRSFLPGLMPRIVNGEHLDLVTKHAEQIAQPLRLWLATRNRGADARPVAVPLAAHLAAPA